VANYRSLKRERVMAETKARDRKNIMTEQIKKLGKGVQIAEEQGDQKLVEGFMADAFRGRISFDEVFPWPEQSQQGVARAELILKELDQFLREKVNPDFTEESGDIPFELFNDMADLGLFRLKIPVEEWGGRGLDQTSYGRVISYLTSYYGPAAILVSADNTIGCKFPILKYGTEEQKKKYLPELTKWPSGFCFTEKNVGSDPARMETYALREYKNGKISGYRITGQKEYTTNSVLSDGIPFAKYLSVVVRIVDDPSEIQTVKDVKKFCFGLFIVSTSSKGLSVGERLDIGPRNEFSGMKGIYNANPLFENVLVSPDQLIGGEGSGFRIALQALNTGRMAIASSCVSIAKQCFSGGRNYAKKRVQWGMPIIKKELIGSGVLARDLCYIFAMDAMARYASLRFDNGKDTRLEATACKVFSSEKMWNVVDNTVQIHGGIGYETHKSSSRRRKVFPAERFFRDARPNRIFEGSTQILSQWSVGEGMKFLKPLAQLGLLKGKTLLILELILNRTEIVDIPNVPLSLDKHLKYVRRKIRKFSNRILFFALRDMALLGFQVLLSKDYKRKISREMLASRQLILWRLFWIVSYLEAMTVSCSQATHFGTDSAIEMADGFCSEARICIDDLFRDLYRNNDRKMRKIADKLEGDGYDWFIHSDILPLVDKLGL
jgi:alkylation response protein AidB-like acyl-CoA dehydrogenase